MDEEDMINLAKSRDISDSTVTVRAHKALVAHERVYRDGVAHIT